MVGGWGTFSPSSDGAEETFPPLLGGGRRRANVGRGEDKNLNEKKKIRNCLVFLSSYWKCKDINDHDLVKEKAR